MALISKDKTCKTNIITEYLNEKEGDSGVNIGVSKKYVDEQDTLEREARIAEDDKINDRLTEFITNSELTAKLDTDFIQGQEYPDPEVVKEGSVRKKEILTLTIDKIDIDIKGLKKAVADMGAGGTPNLTEYAKLEDLDTATKFTAMNPTLDTPAPEVLDKVVTDIENEVKTNTTAIGDLTGRVTNLENSGGGENTFYLDLSNDTIYNEVNCDAIDDSYNKLRLYNINRDYGITIYSLERSNIRKISIEPTEVFTVTSDITYDSTTGANNLLNRATIQSPISFFNDAEITEIFSTNVIIYKEVALGDATIPMYMLDGETFSIEFSEDFTKIVGYFNIDEFFVPWTYVSSTGVATFLSDTMIFCLKNNDNNASFASFESSSVYKLGLISSNAHVVYNTNTLLDSLHHIPVISVSGSINGIVGRGIQTKLLVLLRGNIGDMNSSADQIVSVYAEIANFHKVSKYNSNLTKEILRVYRDLMNGGQIVTEVSRKITGESRINCFGTVVYCNKYFTTNSIIPNEVAGIPSIVNGIWVNILSTVPHAMGTVTYFEKGEFSFPAGLKG